MPRRYYTDEDAISDFVAWSIIGLGVGVVALLKALRPKPAAYNPKAPDNPTHENQLFTLWNAAPKLDFSKAKPPEVDLSDLKNPKFFWADQDRPQWIRPEEQPISFALAPLPAESGVYRIYPPKAAGESAMSINLVRALLEAAPRLSLEIVADATTIFWQITDTEGQYRPEVITSTVQSYHPTAMIVPVEPAPEARQYPFYRQLLLFSLTNEYAAPMPFLSDLKHDPLIAITNRMNLLDPALEERISYRMVTFVDTPEARRRAGSRLLEGQVKPTAGFWKKDDPLSGFDEKLLSAKLDETHYHVFLSVTVESRSERRLSDLGQIARDIGQVKTPRHNGLTIAFQQAIKHEVATEAQANLAWFETFLSALVQMHRPEWRQFLLVLTPPEIASLWHLPDETFTASRIVWSEQTAPSALTQSPKNAVCLGDATQYGKVAPIYLDLKDRAYHHYLAGKTGMGKSTLIHNLVDQDIAAGRGVAVLDPHGKLIDAILARSIPEERRDDVVLLECGRADYPVPLNPFRVPPGVTFDAAFNAVYWVMRKIYEPIWLEGRTDLVIRHVIQALLCDPEATPLDINRLFNNTSYREQLLTRMRQHEEVSFGTIDYWQDFGSRSAGDKREISQPILNRTGAFLGNRTLEHMTCHPNSLNFKALIDAKKIVLVSFAGDALRSEVGSLGAIFVSGFFLASEALGYLPDTVLPRFYLYLDEVERIITTPLPDMLAQARKFGLSLTMANQFLDQLPSDTLRGILGNVGTQLLFEVGSQDAPKLAPPLAPDMSADDLLNLGAYRMVVKTRSQGKSQPAFVVTTRDIPSTDGIPYVRQENLTTDGFLPKDQVRTWLTTRYTSQPSEAEPPKSKKAVSKTDPAEEKKPPSRKKPKDGLEDFE